MIPPAYDQDRRHQKGQDGRQKNRRPRNHEADHEEKDSDGEKDRRTQAGHSSEDSSGQRSGTRERAAELVYAHCRQWDNDSEHQERRCYGDSGSDTKVDDRLYIGGNIGEEGDAVA